MSPLHACFLLCEKKAKWLSHRVVSLTDLSAVAINNPHVHPSYSPPYSVFFFFTEYLPPSLTVHSLLAIFAVCLRPWTARSRRAGIGVGVFLRASVAMATRTLQDVNPPLLGQERRMGCGFRNGGPFTPSKDWSFSGTQ